MTQNQLMTAAAVGMAALALVYISRSTGSPAPAVASQPAQQQRDYGLATWLGTLTVQEQQAPSLIRGTWLDTELRRWEQEMGGNT